MYLFSKHEFLEVLPQYIIEVQFTKASGELRKMKCTLHPDILPDSSQIQDIETKSETDDRMIVWDVEKAGWRSFRLDSVKAVLIPSPDEE